MKCQILFSGKNKKNITNLSSTELAQRVVKVNFASRNLMGQSWNVSFIQHVSSLTSSVKICFKNLIIEDIKLIYMEFIFVFRHLTNKNKALSFSVSVSVSLCLSLSLSTKHNLIL